MATALIIAAIIAIAAGLEPGPAKSALAYEAFAAEAVAALSSPAPAYVRRGDRAESRYRAYRERLERFHQLLSKRVEEIGRDLIPKLKAVAPKATSHGYQILPKLVPDAPAPLQQPRAKSSNYSWPWTEQLIDREMEKMKGLEAELDRMAALAPAERRPAYEKMIDDFRRLSDGQKTIDAHIQYNRLWQSAIDQNKPAYDRQSALHNAVLERQAIVDALNAADDAAFRKGLSEVQGIDQAKNRAELESDLRERGKELARKIQDATEGNPPPPFLRVEHPDPRLLVVHVPFYTDIDDAGFVQSFKSAIESVWRLRDGEDEFRVELSFTHIPATRLYGKERVPSKGEQINVNRHVAVFPKDGAALTTGAVTTHVFGRAIVLGPHDIAPHVLAHEFGHILGFKDVYFRAYKDLGEDGYLVMEAIADPNDIMGAPGTGPVLRRHFEKIIDSRASR